MPSHNGFGTGTEEAGIGPSNTEVRNPERNLVRSPRVMEYGSHTGTEGMTRADIVALGTYYVHTQRLLAELSDDSSFRNLLRTNLRLMRAAGVRPPLHATPGSQTQDQEEQGRSPAELRRGLRAVP